MAVYRVSRVSGMLGSHGTNHAFLQAFMTTDNLKPALPGEIDMRCWSNAVRYVMHDLDWRFSTAAGDHVEIVSDDPLFLHLLAQDPPRSLRDLARHTVARALIAWGESLTTRRLQLLTSGARNENERMERLKRHSAFRLRSAAEKAGYGGLIDIIEGHVQVAPSATEEMRRRLIGGLDGLLIPGPRDMERGVKWVMDQQWTFRLTDDEQCLELVLKGPVRRFEQALDGLTENSPRGVARTLAARCIRELGKGSEARAKIAEARCHGGPDQRTIIDLWTDEVMNRMLMAVQQRGFDGLLGLLLDHEPDLLAA